MCQVVGWYTYWKPKRAFAMDMAGFAVNIQLLHTAPQALFRVSAGRGNQESDLLTQLGVHLSDLEPRADNCTKVTDAYCIQPNTFRRLFLQVLSQSEFQMRCVK